MGLVGTTGLHHRAFSAATWLPKKVGESGAGSSSASLAFKAHAASIPHPEKEYKGGEDAWFVSDDGMAMGVFDGVGAWAEMNIDPGLYSKALAKYANAAYVELGPDSPTNILEQAWLRAATITGSSTACCVTISGSTLRAANLGDSGFLVVRDGSLLHRQAEQQHGFNFPFQLGTGSTDGPDDAECVELQLQEGDVVVVATDGVLDNLFAEEIVAIVREGMSLKKTEAEVATRIAQLSSAKANLSSGRTPFAVNARQAGFSYSGGKLDDITVVVGFVVPKTIKAAL